MIKNFKLLTIFLAMAIYVLSPYICFAENNFGSSSGGFCPVKTASLKTETMERFPPHPINSQQSTTNNQQPTTNYPPSTTITYFYDGDEIENEEDSTGDMSTYLTRSVRGVVDTTGNIKVNYLLSNAKDVIGETDSTGNNITTTYNYDAYGKGVDFATNPQPPTTNHQPLSSFSISDNTFQYSGYYCDKESGLYYLKARYYSPELMTFISMDTYDLANKYAYCNNDPIDATDPNGHISTLEKVGLGIFSFVTGGLSAIVLQYSIPNDVQKDVNIAVTATFFVLSILTAGKTIGESVASGAKLAAVAGATLQGGALVNSLAPAYPGQQVVNLFITIAGFALMGYGMYSGMSAAGDNESSDSLSNSIEEENNNNNQNIVTNPEEHLAEYYYEKEEKRYCNMCISYNKSIDNLSIIDDNEKHFISNCGFLSNTDSEIEISEVLSADSLNDYPVNSLYSDILKLYTKCDPESYDYMEKLNTYKKMVTNYTVHQRWMRQLAKNGIYDLSQEYFDRLAAVCNIMNKQKEEIYNLIKYAAYGKEKGFAMLELNKLVQLIENANDERLGCKIQ